MPLVNAETCNNCGLCVKVCPGHCVNFHEINSFVFGAQSKDKLVGNHLNCYMGYATEDSIRLAGQSGGIVTALLVVALERGLIDGAVVTRMSPSDPLSPETLVAESKEEILSAFGSKYCQVPTNVALKEVLKKRGKYAFVGIPCQMHGVRKLEKVKSELSKKIVLHIGLFCSHTLSFLATELLLYKAGVQKTDLANFEYRSKKWQGWPGDVFFRLKNGKEKFLSRKYRTSITPFFNPWRCKMCYDQLNEFADISCGDALLPEVLSNCRSGMSILITRTEMGEKILQEACSAGAIKIQKTPRSKVIQSQCGALFRKKKFIGAHLATTNSLGKSIPEYHVKLPKPSKTKCFVSLFEYMSTQLPYNPITYNLLVNMPQPLLKLYSFTMSVVEGTRKSCSIWNKAIQTNKHYRNFCD